MPQPGGYYDDNVVGSSKSPNSGSARVQRTGRQRHQQIDQAMQNPMPQQKRVAPRPAVSTTPPATGGNPAGMQRIIQKIMEVVQVDPVTVMLSQSNCHCFSDCFIDMLCNMTKIESPCCYIRDCPRLAVEVIFVKSIGKGNHQVLIIPTCKEHYAYYVSGRGDEDMLVVSGSSSAESSEGKHVCAHHNDGMFIPLANVMVKIKPGLVLKPKCCCFNTKNTDCGCGTCTTMCNDATCQHVCMCAPYQGVGCLCQQHLPTDQQL